MFSDGIKFVYLISNEELVGTIYFFIWSSLLSPRRQHRSIIFFLSSDPKHCSPTNMSLQFTVFTIYESPYYFLRKYPNAL